MKRKMKKRQIAPRAKGPQRAIGGGSPALSAGLIAGVELAASAVPASGIWFSHRNGPKRWRTFTQTIAESVAQNVAIGLVEIDALLHHRLVVGM